MCFHRPFSVQKIPHSNLILLVVDTLCPCGAKRLDVRAREAPPRAACRRHAPRAHRRRPKHCGSYHPEVFTCIGRSCIFSTGTWVYSQLHDLFSLGNWNSIVWARCIVPAFERSVADGGGVASARHVTPPGRARGLPALLDTTRLRTRVKHIVNGSIRHNKDIDELRHLKCKSVLFRCAMDGSCVLWEGADAPACPSGARGTSIQSTEVLVRPSELFLSRDRNKLRLDLILYSK